MYNRYIPQLDGSYQRKRLQEQHAKEPAQQSAPPPLPDQGSPAAHRPPVRNRSVQGFLKGLLPKDMDTGDLIVILLLILMAGDCQEDKNTALLTAALYFIM